MADTSAFDFASLHSAASGEDTSSFLSGVSDFATKGVPLAFASGIVSMYNTGAALGNVFGLELEKKDLAKDLVDYDDDLARYYKDHKQGVDLGGFVLTSIIPGAIGIKALKMAQAGTFGTNAANVLGYFKNSEKLYTARAINKVRDPVNKIFSAVDNDKLAAIAFGVGEQALQGAAFETAVLLSMNQNPVISEADEGYFKSFIRNSHTILTAGAIQGTIGGGLGAFSLSGKLKSAIRARDIEELPSTNLRYVGAQSTDPGTAVAMEFAYLKDAETAFELGKAAGTLTDAQILNYQKSIKTKHDALRIFITEKLLPDKDGVLGEEVWNAINKTADPAETANLMFAAATKLERITTDAEPVGALQILTGSGALTPRHAKNVLKYATDKGKISSQILDNPTPEQLVMETAAGNVLYRDSTGLLHVLEDSDYAKKYLSKAGTFQKSGLIVKLSGDEAGRVTENAYPTVGDLGKVGLSKQGDLVVGESVYSAPAKYNPLENIPLDSNAQFVHAKLRPMESFVKEGVIDIAEGDLPLLEKAAREGFEGEVYYAGMEVGDVLGEVLLKEKQLMRQQLVEAGHDFDQIVRELNVTKEFAETGSLAPGAGFDVVMLSKIEDHTKPIFAAISYDTGLLPKNFSIRGFASLQERIKLGKDQNEVAAAFVLKDHYTRLPNSDMTSFNPTTIPEFSNLFRSSSEDFGTWGMKMQQSGKVVDSAIRQRTQAVYQTLQGPQFQVQANREALIELNVLAAKIRSSGEPYYKYLGGEGDKIYYIPSSIRKAMAEAEKAGGDVDEIFFQGLRNKQIIEPKTQEVISYIDAHTSINHSRVQEINTILQARGSSKVLDGDQVYLPPIDTRRHPFVAFVKEKMDLGEVKEAGVIVAESKESLEAKLNILRKNYGDKFEFVTPTDIKNYKTYMGEYEAGKLLQDAGVDSMLKKEGLLYEFQPRVDAEIFNDFNKWHWNQENSVVRSAVELKYAQEFAELRAMAKQYEEYAVDKFGPKSRKASEFENPYMRYIRTGLNLSDFDRYNSLWGRFNEVTEGVGSKMIGAINNAFNRASAGEIDWQTANRLMESYGFTAPYKGVIEAVVQPRIENARALEPFVAKANGAISTLTLGFDFLNSLINVISFPVMATAEMKNILRHLKDPQIVGKLTELTRVKIPEGAYSIPTPMKLMTNSMKRYFADDGTLLKYYQTIGAIRDPLMLYKEVINASALTEAAVSSEKGFAAWANELAKRAADVGKTVTGHNKAEEFVRFMAADMMKQLTDVAGVAAADAPAYINSFVNRVHGNYLANQRPHLFQGVVGQAISLFQTYQFNLMQNMIRYLGQGDKTAAAMLLGMQNTIFGLQGNPAFYMLNQAVGEANKEHIDIVSGTKMLMGEDVYKWVIYGLGSNAVQTALYNRGDLTPRYGTVVPVTPQDIPAIAIPYKAINSFVESISKVSKGGDVTNSILDGIAHFGANRPLAGLAQLAQGYRTTSKGNLLTAYNDLNGFVVAAKLAGGEELNRGIAIDAYYRNLAYQEADRKKKAELGEALKTTMYKGQMPTPEETQKFLTSYVAAGGNPVGFNQFMMNSFKFANESQLNRLKDHLNTRAGRLQAEMMGADMQDFYRNPPPIEE